MATARALSLLLLLCCGPLAAVRAQGPAPAPAPGRAAAPAPGPTSSSSAPAPGPAEAPTAAKVERPRGYIHIDCGGAENAVQGNHKDLYTTLNGEGTEIFYSLYPSNTVARNATDNATALLTPPERTLRAFPSGGCYVVTSGPGAWSVRLGFAYYNYDGLNTWPNFTVSLNGVKVDQVALADWEKEELWDPRGNAPLGGTPGTGHYTEYVSRFNVSTVQVCLYSVDGSVPILNSLEMVPYGPVLLGELDVFLPNANWILSVKERMRLGGGALGPSVRDDPLMRRWKGQGASTPLQFDTQNGLQPTYRNATNVNATATLAAAASSAPLPPKLFQSALEGGLLSSPEFVAGAQFLGVRTFFWPLNPANHYVVRLFFADPDGAEAAQGQRVFNVTVATSTGANGALLDGTWQPYQWAVNFDIQKMVVKEGFPAAGFPFAFFGCHPDPPPQRTNISLYVFLSSTGSPLPPVLSGVELYEVVVENDAIGFCPALDVQPFSIAAQGTNYPPISDQPYSSGLSTAAIAGIVVVSVVGVVLLVALAWYGYHKRQEHLQVTEFQRFQQEHRF